VLPYTPSLDVSAMDRSVDPREDPYTYACGGWKKNNPIPPDQNRWSVYATQEQTKAIRVAERDGLTPAQRFFVGFAQWACTNDRPENMRVNAVVDPHSPPPVRINGVVVNMAESATAFSCKANAKLVKKPQDLCKVW
jgi:predicted metalloendopeptidase